METLKLKIDYTNYHLSTSVDWILHENFIPNKEPDYVSFVKDYDSYGFDEIKECFDEEFFSKEIKKAIEDLKIKLPNEIDINENWLITEERFIENNLKIILKNLELKDKKITHFFRDRFDLWRFYYPTDKPSSKYYYGEDEKGKYIIRESDHWGNVATCLWNLKTPDETGQLFEVDNSERIYYEDDEGYDQSYLSFDVCFGKAYLKDFIENNL